MPGRRERLDKLLAERLLAPTREKARALIMAGRVTVDGRRVDKPGTGVSPEARIEVDPGEPYVGRGGRKLAGALDALALDVAGQVVLDLGASTGGFTDCLLQRGAARVYAVDVGRGLIDPKLRADPRVTLLEGINARRLDRDLVPEPIGLATADLAFISLRLVLPAAVPLLADEGELLVLVKPQFELGRGQVGKGVVRDPAKHALAVRTVADAARALGLAVRDVVASPLLGAKGNREFFLHLARAGVDAGRALDARIDAAVSLPGAAPGTAPGSGADGVPAEPPPRAGGHRPPEGSPTSSSRSRRGSASSRGGR